jgi:hypothetical protein
VAPPGPWHREEAATLDVGLHRRRRRSTSRHPGVRGAQPRSAQVAPVLGPDPARGSVFTLSSVHLWFDERFLVCSADCNARSSLSLVCSSSLSLVCSLSLLLLFTVNLKERRISGKKRTAGRSARPRQ